MSKNLDNNAAVEQWYKNVPVELIFPDSLDIRVNTFQEAIAAMYLWLNDIHFIYSPETLKFEYNGIDCNYTPSFLLPQGMDGVSERKVLLEVNWHGAKQDIVKEGMAGAMQSGYSIVALQDISFMADWLIKAGYPLNKILDKSLREFKRKQVYTYYCKNAN